VKLRLVVPAVPIQMRTGAAAGGEENSMLRARMILLVSLLATLAGGCGGGADALLADAASGELSLAGSALPIASVADSADDRTNVAANAIDGSTQTR
jgi:hypothetical protein